MKSTIPRNHFKMFLSCLVGKRIRVLYMEGRKLKSPGKLGSYNSDNMKHHNYLLLCMW